jgi:hypothetical protein
MKLPPGMSEAFGLAVPYRIYVPESRLDDALAVISEAKLSYTGTFGDGTWYDINGNECTEVVYIIDMIALDAKQAADISRAIVSIADALIKAGEQEVLVIVQYERPMAYRYHPSTEETQPDLYEQPVEPQPQPTEG